MAHIRQALPKCGTDLQNYSITYLRVFQRDAPYDQYIRRRHNSREFKVAEHMALLAVFLSRHWSGCYDDHCTHQPHVVTRPRSIIPSNQYPATNCDSISVVILSENLVP
ncbi:hypothetical protein CY34DRAFT_472726 [Suillus luteus UH-Slu-Lm8-n1]|uniref:Uncharacterized protein n=1 Tax=Suillus luteus UH-Slu-Lm8-n1 TaxID=930992 RepID=A0A0D0BJ45_9AGAM|nr:hypothetical protein CY34DRAFT_472726 [Suillus luteus UH-Slu-Lm8-n1]